MLLDSFEKSATYQGRNKVNQTFSCKPEEVFPAYHADTANIVEVETFEREVQELAESGLIRMIMQRGVIQKIALIPAMAEECRTWIGREDRKAQLQRSEVILRSYLDRSEMLRSVCKAQLERLRNFKSQDITNKDELLADALRCIAAIEQNSSELMEREFSISLFGDSKYFERNLKSSVCTQLLKFSPYGEEICHSIEPKQRNAAILSCYQIEQNPSYIYMKGDGEIRFADGTIMQLSANYPVAISSSVIPQMQKIIVKSDTVMTIENLTTYHRMKADGRFLVYLSGYHNTAKTRFLTRLAEGNTIADWQHFGDIDPDGFAILQNLIRKTGLPFQPVHMSTAELLENRNCWKPLTVHDKKKAEQFVKDGIYPEIMQFCLAHDCKLEQEIVGI